MPVFVDPTPQPPVLTPAQQAARRVVNIGNSILPDNCQKVNDGYNVIWNNPRGVAPLDVWAALGVQAAIVQQEFADFTAYLISKGANSPGNPTVPTAPPPGWTVSFDNTGKFNGTPPAPTVTRFAPAEGPAAGGTSVVITGVNFTGATAVHFGAVQAASFTVDSDTQITAVSPAQADGVADIMVTTPSGDSPLTLADQFTYAG